MNLSKNAHTAVKYGEPIIKDQIVKFIFSNLIVDEEKVLTYQLKEPFATLLKTPLILNGREAKITSRTNYIRNLLDTIIKYWEYSKPLNKTLTVNYSPDYITVPVGYIY